MSGVEIDPHDHPAWDTVVRQLQPADPAGNLFAVMFNARDQPVGTARFSLPDPPDPEMTARIGLAMLGTLQREGWAGITHCVLAGYGPAHLAGPVTETAGSALAAAGVDITDAVRVDGGRCWSYLCPEPEHHAGGPGLPVDPLSDTAIQVATVLELARDQEPG